MFVYGASRMSKAFRFWKSRSPLHGKMPLLKSVVVTESLSHGPAPQSPDPQSRGALWGRGRCAGLPRHCQFAIYCLHQLPEEHSGIISPHLSLVRLLTQHLFVVLVLQDGFIR